MDKVYKHKDVEEKIYKSWEEKGFFRPEVNPKGKPFSIILPPPNANAPLHFGHAMYVIEDILIRYHRMKGDKTLWLPGADHAGFETQFVFEKKLQGEGKSRFDFDRETLYKMIWDFVSENRPVMEGQLRRLGFSLDWGRKKFTLDPDIVKIVYRTFKKLYDDGLVYRAERLVNYCTYDGTRFSDLEVLYEERKDPLYYIKYGPLVLATTRPETKFGDTAVAVHPDDKRYQKYIDKEIEIETVLGKAKIKVIADDFVDMEFGTGVVKITPAHDFDDNEVASRHNLPLKQVIGFDGKMNEKAGKFEGLYVKQARKAVVEEMQNKGLLEKVDENYTHRIGLCYKCKNPIEPLPLEQWFVKTGELAKPAISAVKKGLPAGRQGKIKIYPKNFEKIYFDFLENIRDWNISRQIVWGIRVPAYKCRNPKSEIRNPKSKNEWFISEIKPEKCEVCGECDFEQDPDTFDTWFSSGQWPFATLQTNKEGDFKTFYPTSVMETGYDILRWWVARMVMLGIYETGKIPFVNILLHGLVNDPLGKKMSKSKGNAVNPLELVDQYGADAVRFALVYGTATGNDQSLSYPKLQSMRNFTNKLWNIGRFLQLQLDSGLFKDIKPAEGKREPEKYKEMVESVDNLSKKVSESLDQYRFHDAANELYEFIWHVFADKYIEELKEPLKDGEIEALAAFIYVWETSLKLLHPFMPFITEELWRKIPEAEGDLIVSKWPSFAKASEGKPL